MAETREWFRAIPVPKSEDKALQQTLEAIKENVETLAGVRGKGAWKPGEPKWNNTALTMGDLIDSDFLDILVGLETSVVNVDPGEVVWGDAPPPPTDLHRISYKDDDIASPWYHHLEWTNPVDLSNVYFIEVWSSTIDSISSAKRIAIVTPPNNSIIVYGVILSSDYYYWVRSMSYGYKHSTWEPSPDQGGYLVESKGSISDIIETIMNILKGETPPAWESSIKYGIGDQVSITDGTNTRKYQCILQHTNQEPPNVTYWKRIGILMEGEVDGSAVVGIDGHLVVDGTILAHHIAADQIEGTHILAGEIIVAHIGDTDSILNANQQWSDIKNIPDGVQQIFYQATAPVSGMDSGDWWMDTDDDRFYRYNGAVWVETQDVDIIQAIQDAADAQSTADGKIVTFTQPEPPTAEGVGDIWFDSNDGYKIYRWSGSAWVEHKDTDIAQAINDAAGAQATADGKVTTFYQDAEPTAEGVGDLWVDTNDGNTAYRWSGSVWVEITDEDIANALASAANAQSTADGKITTFYQDAIPTGDEGDIWFDTNDNNKPYVADSDNSNEIKSGEWERALPKPFGGPIVDDATPTGAGLYLGADYMGYYSGSIWHTYINSSGTAKFGTGTEYFKYSTAGGVKISTSKTDAITIEAGGDILFKAITSNSSQLKFDCNNRTFTFQGSFDNDMLSIISDTDGTGKIYFGYDIDALTAKRPALFGCYASQNIAFGTVYNLTHSAIVEQTCSSNVNTWEALCKSGAGMDYPRITVYASSVSKYVRIEGDDFSPRTDSTITSGTSALCWSNIYGDAGVTSCSDRKWKINVQESPLGLSFINNLDLVQWEWDRSKGKNLSRKWHGVLSQDVLQVLENMGYTNEDFGGIEINAIIDEETHEKIGENWGFRYEQLIAPLCKAVQELSVEVELLKVA